MNRRELAKNGFLALCGVLLGLVTSKKPDKITITGSGLYDGEYQQIGDNPAIELPRRRFQFTQLHIPDIWIES